MLIRSSGVLANISSLPGDFGIGDFSAYARRFAEDIFGMGFRWWQILPLNPVGVHNSPYDSFSAYAGNYLYIDPYGLVEDGFLTFSDVAPYMRGGQRHTVEYETVKFNKRQILRRAFELNAEKIPAVIAGFEAKNSFWLEDYAAYMALKSHYSDAPWAEWDEDIRFKRQPAYGKLIESLSKYALFFKFEQYLFWKQWENLKSYVNSLGVNIIGDSPIYVAYDSADVFFNPQYFQLGKNLEMKKTAGVPPDYFSENGQLWNNPLYDFKEMKKDGYSWFIKRVGRLLSVYDCVRIDHFRGFHSYYAVNADSATAANGEWKKAPGRELFGLIKKRFGDAAIIAEDLGIIDGGVRDFLNRTGYPGMRVLQFGFYGGDSEHIPYNYVINSVAYTGTHDNDTVLGWLYNLNDGAREYALRYCGFSGGDWGRGGKDNTSVKAVIRTLIASVSALAVIPVQDMCGFGGDTRMNLPGRADGNWLFRLPEDYMSRIDGRFFTEINNIYGRNNTVRPVK
ncbi:MAG: 4-alpha-glucanotransferase [Clostridiales bacterium]|jgi:4-alpha-glucanotransferase|nr:4-alpha-glucanotransferase [Clostridiales bacterium]